MILIRELTAERERSSAGDINRQWRADMATDINFLRRKHSSVPEHLPATPGYSRKSAEAFLDDFAETKKENAIVRRALEDAGIDNDKLKSQLEWHKSEMKRIERGREEYRNQYSELMIQLKVIVTTAVSASDQCKGACDAVVSQAKASLEAVRQAMTAVGVDPLDHELPPADEDISRIAATYGADNRKEEPSG